MKARKLVDGMTLAPEVLKVIGQAFDEAWQEIAGNFGSDPQEIEAARLKLTDAFNVYKSCRCGQFWHDRRQVTS